MTAELDGIMAGDDGPISILPISNTRNEQPGLETSGSASIPPDTYPGSSSYAQVTSSQTGNLQARHPHASDLQTATIQDAIPPLVPLHNRPTLNRQDSISQADGMQNNGRRRSSQLSSDPLTGNTASEYSPTTSRRPSFPFPPLNSTRLEIVSRESDRRGSNTQTLDHPVSNVLDGKEEPSELAASVSRRDSLQLPWWKRRTALHRAFFGWRRYFYMLLLLTTGLLIGLVVVLVIYLKSKGNKTAALTETVLQQSNSLPIAESRLGAAAVLIGTYFSTTASSILQTKVVYNGGNGKLCIRTKSGSAWLSNAQCVEGANPRDDTPITVLDWLGGPSIYFITADNFLSGIDHMPLNDTWKISSVASQNRPTHKQSQLASVTWFNGTSAWLYYQDGNNQLREFGIDDYRDNSWRDGSVGPLGLALAGSGIGTARWILAGNEVLEVFVQVSGGAIHERVYMNFAWGANFYAVDGTPNTISEGAALTSTVVSQSNTSMVLLAYASSDGYLTTQSRGTANGTQTQFNAFTVPEKILQGDGSMETGMAAFGSPEGPQIYFVTNQKILEISASDVNFLSWTQFVVTSA